MVGSVFIRRLHAGSWSDRAGLVREPTDGCIWRSDLDFVRHDLHANEIAHLGKHSGWRRGWRAAGFHWLGRRRRIVRNRKWSALGRDASHRIVFHRLFVAISAL